MSGCCGNADSRWRGRQRFHARCRQSHCGLRQFVIENRYFTFEIFTMLPFACGSFGSLTTVTYNSFSPSLNATFVVPSPAAISNTWSSLPSGDIFKILPSNQFRDEPVVVDLPKFISTDSNVSRFSV